MADQNERTFQKQPTIPLGYASRPQLRLVLETTLTKCPFTGKVCWTDFRMLNVVTF